MRTESDVVNNVWQAPFSRAEYRRRHERYRVEMDARSLDCLVIYGTGTFFGSDPGSPNVMYLAGYPPVIGGYLVFPRIGEPMLALFAAGHVANAKDLAVVEDIRAGHDIAAVAVARIRELNLGAGRIGLVGNFGWTGVSVPFEHQVTFTRAFPAATFENVTDWFERVRLVKSGEEISVLEKAAALCDEGQELARTLIRDGKRDIDIQNEVQALVHRRGGRTTFGHIQPTPMDAPEMSYPSFYPIGLECQPGDVVMTEFTAGLGGYFGKLFGTLFRGEPNSRYRDMFERASNMYGFLHDRVKPGMRVRDVDALAAAYIRERDNETEYIFAGWSTYNTPPALNPRDSEWELDLELRPGLALSVVGRIRSKDHSAGLWVGDTSVMTDRGLRNLHVYPVADLEHAIV